MRLPLAVVISCAGRGSRLGLGTTKALAMIGGRPLIAWHLDLLARHPDVRVVVGYDARRLIDAVRAIRRDVLFVFNHDYRGTGTAASISLAARGLPPGAQVLSIDGDLLVHPRSLAELMAVPGNRLGVLSPLAALSSEPVCALIDERKGLVHGFTRGETKAATLEWSGLFRGEVDLIHKANALGLGRNHVYQMLEPFLPMPYLEIDATEIDTPEDFRRAEAWMAKARQDWKPIS
jgi:choline kinase